MHVYETKGIFTFKKGRGRARRGIMCLDPFLIQREWGGGGGGKSSYPVIRNISKTAGNFVTM